MVWNGNLDRKELARLAVFGKGALLDHPAEAELDATVDEALQGHVLSKRDAGYFICFHRSRYDFDEGIRYLEDAATAGDGPSALYLHFAYQNRSQAQKSLEMLRRSESSTRKELSGFSRL